MKEKIFKVGISLLLIVTLTAVNFLTVGVALYSYAMEEVATAVKTNHENINFMAFFKDEAGNEKSIQNIDINTEQSKMFIKVNVEKEGYFNGEIKLADSNFKFVSSSSEYVSKVTSDTITLNQINAGANPEIEVVIANVVGEQLDVTMLNKTSKISINGTYRDSTEKDIKVTGNTNVQTNYTSSCNVDNLINNVEVITNKIATYKNEEKRIVQFSIKTGINQNSYPIKNIEVKVNVPEINGKLPTIENKSNLSNMTKINTVFNETEKTETITMENEKDSNNKILFKKSSNEEVILTYIYDKDVKFENTEITSNIKMTLFNDTSLESNKNVKISNEEKDGIINLTNKTTSEIYKGALYSGLTKSYNTQTNMQVNLNEIANAVNIVEKETSIPSIYNKTTINKQQLLNMIGESGKVEFATLANDGTTKTICSIDSKTEADEQGNINIVYNEEISNLIIKTTKPQAIGDLVFNHIKTIKVLDKQKIKETQELVSQVVGEYKTVKETGKMNEITSAMKMLESVTDAKLEINRNDLSTITTNKNVEIKAILKANEEKYDLYQNPILQIILPSDITEIKLNSIDKLYGDEFAITNVTEGQIDGKHVIQIALEGIQKAYKELGVEGTVISINADLTLNNKAISKQDGITLVYSNENANQYKEAVSVGTEKVDMQIVSPKGLITTNEISELGIQTIGDKNQETKQISKQNEAKKITVQSEIINNNETAINNVLVLGNIGTDGKVENEKENNLHTKILSLLSVEGAEGIKVYYSENENATNDINNAENKWVENVTDTSKLKKYLISIGSMQVGQNIKVKYELEIPANLEYNMTSYIGYKASYIEETTNTSQEIKSTEIQITTGQGPIIEAKLEAKLGNKTLQDNENVKQGETIKYTTTLTNTGTQNANVSVFGTVPEGTKLVENSKLEQSTEVAVGETKKVEYEVKVNNDAKVDSTINEQETIKYEDVTKQTNTVSNNVEEGTISVRIENDKMTEEDEYGKKENSTIYTGQTMSYTAVVSNLTNETQENIEFTWEIPDELEIISQTMTDQAGINAMENNLPEALTMRTTLENKKQITIKKIPGNEKVQIFIVLKVKEMEEASKNLSIAAKVSYKQKEYNSSSDEITINNNKQVEIKLSSTDENEYKKAGDKIIYTITITNNNEIDLNEVLIQDNIPAELTIKKITNGTKEETIPDSNLIQITTKLLAGEERKIEIETLVNYIDGQKEEIKISNSAKLNSDNVEKETNTVSHIITPSENKDSDQEKEKDKYGKSVYKINGIVWEDSNQDGQRQDEEPSKQGLTVQLLNITTNTLATDSDGNIISTTTGSDGTYTLTKVPEGQYIVLFNYDTSSYYVTEYKKAGIEESRNSDALSKRVTVNGEEKIFAVTDTIKIDKENVANINLGLIKSAKFDLKLEKFINRVAIQNDAETKINEYQDATLAKLELDAKKISGSTIIVEYKIKVSNIGELEGYAKKIADYLPKDLIFNSELNPDWYKEGENLYSNSITNDKLSPGETKEITLILTKEMTESNTGLVNNMAEIFEDYNNSGVTDINSTPANKAKNENDLGSADLIISIRTGSTALYITLTIAVLIVLAVIIMFVQIKINHVKESSVTALMKGGKKVGKGKK